MSENLLPKKFPFPILSVALITTILAVGISVVRFGSVIDLKGPQEEATPAPGVLPNVTGKSLPEQRRILARYLAGRPLNSVARARVLTRYGDPEDAHQAWLKLVPGSRRIYPPSSLMGGDLATPPLVPPVTVSALLDGVTLMRSLGDSKGAELLLEKIATGANMDDEPLLRAIGATKEADATRQWWLAELNKAKAPRDTLRLLPATHPLPPELFTLLKNHISRMSKKSGLNRDDYFVLWNVNNFIDSKLKYFNDADKYNDCVHLKYLLSKMPKKDGFEVSVKYIEVLNTTKYEPLEAHYRGEGIALVIGSVMLCYDRATAMAVAEKITDSTIRQNILSALQRDLFPLDHPDIASVSGGSVGGTTGGTYGGGSGSISAGSSTEVAPNGAAVPNGAVAAGPASGASTDTGVIPSPKSSDRADVALEQLHWIEQLVARRPAEARRRFQSHLSYLKESKQPNLLRGQDERYQQLAIKLGLSEELLATLSTNDIAANRRLRLSLSQRSRLLGRRDDQRASLRKLLDSLDSTIAPLGLDYLTLADELCLSDDVVLQKLGLAKIEGWLPKQTIASTRESLCQCRVVLLLRLGQQDPAVLGLRELMNNRTWRPSRLMARELGRQHRLTELVATLALFANDPTNNIDETLVEALTEDALPLERRPESAPPSPVPSPPRS